MSLALQDPGTLLLGARTAATAAAIAVAVLAWSARPWRGRGAPLRPSGPPLALALAVALAFLVSRGAPSLPPASAVEWLFYAALAGGACGLLEARRVPGTRFVHAALATLLPVLLLTFQRRYWGRAEGIAWTAGLAALVLLSWGALATRERRADADAWPTLGLALATALSARAYQVAGASLLLLLPVALALATGACALVGLWRRAGALGPAGVAPFVLLHFGILWVARWLNELTPPAFALLSAVPLAAALAARLPIAPRPRAALGLLAPTLLALAAALYEGAQAPPLSPYR